MTRCSLPGDNDMMSKQGGGGAGGRGKLGYAYSYQDSCVEIQPEPGTDTQHLHPAQPADSWIIQLKRMYCSCLNHF